MGEYNQRVTLWAARVLSVDPSAVQSVETDSWGLCDTCEFSEGEITVTLTDGRVFEGRERFGLFLADVLNLDLNEDGTLTKYADGELFELTERT